MEYLDNMSERNQFVISMIEVLKMHVNACCLPGVHPNPNEIHFNVLYLQF